MTMTRARISETDPGITVEFNTQMYDTTMRNMRDKGWKASKNHLGIVIPGYKL